jgi:hypothetical protein
MLRKILLVCCYGLVAVSLIPENASALSRERWTNSEPTGVFFNRYDPNFYTGFVPRVQDRKHITIHVGRGNQVRLRMVLPEETIENYLPDQFARYSLYKELIGKNIIKLTSNAAWEDYDARVMELKLGELAKRKSSLSQEEWRQLNLEYIDKLNPGRLYHIQRDFEAMVDNFAETLRTSKPPESLEAKLDLINDFFPHRIFLTDLTAAQDTAFSELQSLARSGNMDAFRAKSATFFHDITQNIYQIKDGKLDFYEFTSIFPMGSYDALTTYQGHKIPKFVTTGVWWLIPRQHGKGYTGMVDYISSAGYYGLMPMLPYEYAGGIAYNAFHNPGISNWMQGHPLLPNAWKKTTAGSRSGKPFRRLSITSRGPVSHGCSRLNSGHLIEFREMLPSTSADMEGIRVFMPLSYCYDVFDINGDGTEEVMGIQYYLAFRHNKSRVATQIWAQNNREDYYRWLYDDEIVYGPPGKVIVKEAYDCKYVKRKAIQGKKYEDIKLYEAPEEPEYIQFYVINGLNSLSKKAMDFNRELRRVGHGYNIDRKLLLLD